MKTVILALLVLLVISQGEALRCYCGGSQAICSSSIETCYGSNQVCASVILHPGPTISYFKRCMSADDCRLLSSTSVSTATCCSSDLCNN